MIFKDEHGNVVTPDIGDFVMKSDIKDEAMFDEIKDCFASRGCKLSVSSANYRGIDFWTAVGWLPNSITGNESIFVWLDHEVCHWAKRRLFPHQLEKKTLFEAACEAPVGTRWELLGYDHHAVKKSSYQLVWSDDEENVAFLYMQTTDFKVVPSVWEPKEGDYGWTCLADGSVIALGSSQESAVPTCEGAEKLRDMRIEEVKRQRREYVAK